MNVERIFEGLSPEEKIKNLVALAAKTEKQTYSRNLTEAEVTHLEKQHLALSRDYKRIEDEKKEVNETYKNQLKTIKTEMEEILDATSNRKKSVVGVLYSIPDYAEQLMRLYDENGDQIDTRPLKPEEKQSRAFIQTATEETVINPDEPINTDLNEKHEELEFEEVANSGIIPASTEELIKLREAALELEGFVLAETGLYWAFYSKTDNSDAATILCSKLSIEDADEWKAIFDKALEEKRAIIEFDEEKSWEGFEQQKQQELNNNSGTGTAPNEGGQKKRNSRKNQ